MTAKIDQDHYPEITRRRNAGESLSSIAQTYEASGEWVRQVIEKNELPAADATVAAEVRAKAHQDQLDALREEMVQLREEDPSLTFSEAALKAKVPLSRARAAVPSSERRMFGVRRNVESTYSEDQIVADLKKAAEMVDKGVLSRQKYDKVRAEIADGDDMISGVRILQVFGSWARACERAGVRSGTTNRANYSRNWTDADLLGWVVRFFADKGAQSTYEDLGIWLSEHKGEGAPSAPTVRIRLGRWSKIREDAMRLSATA